jgi:6-phosphogluconolactonase (cycloisomerase 2 family)
VAPAVAVALAASLAAASLGLGASGDLKPLACLEDTGGPDACARSAPGLDGAAGLAVSRDGRSVYVTAFDDDAIVHLRRNRRNGSLRVGECIDDPSGLGTCDDTADGLNGARDLAVSADGRHVYTIAYGDSTLLHFKASRATGALRLVDCVDDAGLAPVNDVCPGGANGLQGPGGIALSPDGRSLYVAAQLDDTVVRFALNRQGRPRPRECFDDDDSIADDCGVANEREGLGNAGAVAVAPNGRSVYVASSSDDAITHFKRKRSGELVYRECVENRNPAGPDGCARKGDGMNEVRSLGISPDGRFLYGGTINDASVAQFKLGRGGRLGPRGCIEGPFSSAECATVAQGIGRAADFAFDRRGRSMYVAGGDVQPFKRAPGSGELTERPCIEDDDLPTLGTSCTRETSGLAGAFDLAMSPDDRFLYASAQTDNAVVTFRRAR